MRRCVGLIALSACAGGAPAGPCSDPSAPCLDEVDPAARESRVQVERAERARKRSAFSAQVDAWRSQLVSASSTPAAEAPPSRAAASPELETSPARTRGVAGIRSASSSRPAPAVLLRGAACLLADDLPLLEARVQRARRDRRPRAGEVALVWLDARALADRVAAARRFDEAVPCEAAEAARTLTRTLVGPAPLSEQDVSGYARGLARLVEELETHAGLAPP